MYVIGTAGHVDHGKSTLVKALTNIDPDRLPEEKEREMTIDLGFAWMTLPSGREVSIVDVPGHERFIKNMLAGVGGIDVAMLVVAADESVMPQTREHVAILGLLQVEKGLVAITKIDMADEELVELVKSDVAETLQGTSLEGCPMLAVSAYTGDGMDQLRTMLDQILEQAEPRRDLGRPRLPVDRCFTVSGFGTVVTGTLIDGGLAVGQEVELAPSGQHCRIRGLQSHKNRVDRAKPGVRLAVNLSGVTRGDVQRGEVLTIRDWLKPSYRLDAIFRMARGAPRSLRHNQGITFHLLTSESSGRVRLLDSDELAPGAEGLVQIILSDPVTMVKRDYFIVRSAEDTLGGGQVIDPNPRRRHRRFASEVREKLTKLHQGTGEDVILSLVDQSGPCDVRTLSRRSNVSESEVVERIAQLAKEGEVIVLGGNPPNPVIGKGGIVDPVTKGAMGDGFSTGHLGVEAASVVYSSRGWESLKSKILTSLQTHHNQYPLRRGAPAQEARSRSGLTQPVFLQVANRLSAEGFLVDEGQVFEAS